jgi:hypothetical protein
MATKLSDEDLAKLASAIGAKSPSSASVAAPPHAPTDDSIRPKTRRKTFRLRDIIPRWGYEASAWMNQQHEGSSVFIASIISLLVFFIGGAMLFGDGYTSIQGIRIPLSMFGVSVKTTGIPSIWWWMLPLTMTLFEIFGKHIPGLKLFWVPVIFFDGLTTALYVAAGLGRFLLSAGHPILLPTNFWQMFSLDIMTGILIVAFISGIVGLLLAILAEQVFLSSLIMVRGSIFRKR